MAQSHFERMYKIVAAGEGGVGKTTLLHQYVTGTFLPGTGMTIGIEFHHKEISINGENYSLQLWDFGGQERFRFMLPNYMLGAKGALLLFDTTRMSTLENLEEWVKICRTNDPELPILFVGTKIDLVAERSVTEEAARSYLAPLGLFDYIEVSALTGENVDEVFQRMVQKITSRVT